MSVSDEPGSVVLEPGPDAQLQTRSGRPLLETVAVFAGGNSMAMVLTLVAGVLAARVVRPEVLGLFNGFGLVFGYLPFFHLGVPTGLARELPFHIGGGRRQHACDLAAVAQGWAILLGGVALVVLACLAAWGAVRGDWFAAAGWGTMAVNATLFFYATNYLEVTFRTTSDFSRLAVVNMARACVALVLVAAVWAFGFFGLCLRSLATVVVGFVLLWRWRPLRLVPRLDLPQLWRLGRVGAPLFAVAQAYAFWAVLDKTLVLKLLGPEGLGLYSLAIMVLPAANLLPRAVNQIMYPRMVELYGREGTMRPLVGLVLRPMLLLAGAMAAVTVAGWLLLPTVVGWLLPSYVGGVDAARWTLVLAFLFSFQPLNSIFVTVRRQGLYFVAIAGGYVGYLAALGSRLGEPVELVAFPQAMIAGRVVFLVICYALLFRLVRTQDKGRAAE